MTRIIRIIKEARNQARLTALDFARGIFDDFVELHGDRSFRDDGAIIGGIGNLDGRPITVVGIQKGKNLQDNLRRNFGQPHPEGYRKALRLMKSAEKFNLPIVTFIDTPGAYPGIEAEERGQGEAIARNLLEMSRLQVPIIVFIIGEGASGGALGIGVGDKVFMLENTWYSVISPESCSSILWRTWEYKERAADALKLTAKDMKANGLIDEIIKEPLGGAHRNREAVFESVKKAIEETYKKLSKLSVEKLIEKRMDKYTSYGVYK